jgi:hypothetical protein
MADELDQIKKILGGDQSNINTGLNSASVGLNMDQTLNQIKPGTLTYALNAALENFDASSVNYQNEQGNEFCLQFPSGYSLIGTYFINEKNKHIFFIANPLTGDSEIGYMDNNDCQYQKLVNATCLNFSIDHPIHKVAHKTTNCTTEIYWTDGFNPRRYLDIENIPYLLVFNSDLCDPTYTDQLDCNQLKLQPNFNIPSLNVSDITTGGDLTAGTYQFAIQYSDPSGNPYTSYYSVTNPTPIADIALATVNFNYQVGKSIILDIGNLDVTGQFQYFNLAVIKTINNISAVELVGTYFIEEANNRITYTGQVVDSIRLSINDIFEKFPYYEIADDLTAVQDVLVWKGLTSIDRTNYQSIASQISLLWETYKIPDTENYADELNATNLRGYLRDEVYAFEIVFLLDNGKQTDGFHIPGREANPNDLVLVYKANNDDFIGDGDEAPYWQIYNTASVLGISTNAPIGNATAYQYGEFAYWESIDEYPCNNTVWGELAGQRIRHHKFPDVLISPINDTEVFSSLSAAVMGNKAVYPLGVRIDTNQVITLIQNSTLTQEQKNSIVGYKIVRGDRGTNKSIVAKGILRNVNKYKREEQEFYYPNYPYNDLNEDPFINENNNAWTLDTTPWLVTCDVVDPTLGYGLVSYIDPNSNREGFYKLVLGETLEFCSVTRPRTSKGTCTIGPANYDVWYATGCLKGKGYHIIYDDPFTNDNTASKHFEPWLQGTCSFSCDSAYVRTSLTGKVTEDCKQSDVCAPCTCCASFLQKQLFETMPKNIITSKLVGRRSSLSCDNPKPLPYSIDDQLKHRQIFNSPETSFGQPFLGNVLKLENVIFGKGQAHFVQVRDNANYRLLTKEAQQDAYDSSYTIAGGNAAGLFAAYQAYLTIYINGITRRNYAYSYNSIADYNYNVSVTNDGFKQRMLDIKKYLIPAVQNVGDDFNINNFDRETSVFLKTRDNLTSLPFPSSSANMLTVGLKDKSRLAIGESGACATPAKEQDISVVSYYASLKNIFVNQWGQIYSYKTIDTGFQVDLSSTSQPTTIFGGDTFISRFTFKTKLPFFIDNRVNAPDDSDIFYDEIGNIAYPKYWHSARSVLSEYRGMQNFISYKAHSFDCPNYDPVTGKINAQSGSDRTFYDGYFYLFAYGIPNFYCESSYNTDLRQAFNNREGDFWPHVSTGIPDDWVQESFVSIANDNTYNYNVTYSKQNKENFFSHLPPDWEDRLCFTNYPFRAIYSDLQNTDADNRINNWLIYRSTSYFDFPQNYGALVSLDGIQNKAVLARFENKSLLYDNLLTIDTSNPQAAYMGNPLMFRKSPPIDFAETDLGYVGSQNKFLLKIPQGQVTVDAKRGQVFLISSEGASEISGFGSGVNRFMTDHLSFEISRYFPTYQKVVNGQTVTIPGVDTDNHFNGIGLHGVYDSKFERVIITKLDYIPIDKDVKYDPVTKEFYVETVVYINAPPTTTTTSSSSTSSTSTTSTSTSSSTTTTTTTAEVSSYYFENFDVFYCGECAESFGIGAIYNAYPLPINKWYQNFGFGGGNAMFYITDVGIPSGVDPGSFILPNSGVDNCVDVICPTTTTTTTADPCTGYTIGQAAEGGIIAYILQPEDQGYVQGECHGLVAMTTYIFQAEWGCQGLDIFQAEQFAIGRGLSNSLAIEAACFSSTAASYSLAIVEGGYNDWYLPSQGELYELYLNRVAIGGFATERYWSSTQQTSLNATAINFSNGSTTSEQKSQAFRFRPIRSF